MCIVHCLAMPFVIAVLPIVAITFGNNGHFHALMLWLVVPTSAVGFRARLSSAREGRNRAAGCVAVAILAIVALWGHAAWDASTEVAVNVAASVLLAGAHWRNFREVRRITATATR